MTSEEKRELEPPSSLARLITEIVEELNALGNFELRTMRILSGRCVNCAVKRDDEDKDPRCRNCRK